MNLAQQITEKLGGEWHCRYGLAPDLGIAKTTAASALLCTKAIWTMWFCTPIAATMLSHSRKAWRNEGLLPRRGQGDYVIDPAKIGKAKLEQAERRSR